MKKPTIYNNVIFRGQYGTVRLSESKIAFKSDNWQQSAGYDSWRWTAIAKHQVNSKTSKKALLKLVSKADPKKCAIFQVENHNVLQQIRDDVSERLRHAKEAIMRRESVCNEGWVVQDRFESRRSSDTSFATVKSKQWAPSITSTSLEDEKHRFMRADTDKTSNRRQMLLLDPGLEMPAVRRTSEISLDSIKTKQPSVTRKTNRRQNPLAISIFAGIVSTIAFHKAASFGFLNGVTDNSSLKDRITPRIFRSQPEVVLNLENHEYCVWERDGADHIEKECRLTIPLTALK